MGMRRNYPKYTLRCVGCKREYACARPDGAFCGSKCRQAGYRDRLKADAAARELVAKKRSA